jgi:hypothetical protein
MLFTNASIIVPIIFGTCGCSANSKLSRVSKTIRNSTRQASSKFQTLFFSLNNMCCCRYICKPFIFDLLLDFWKQSNHIVLQYQQIHAYKDSGIVCMSLYPQTTNNLSKQIFDSICAILRFFSSPLIHLALGID